MLAHLLKLMMLPVFYSHAMLQGTKQCDYLKQLFRKKLKRQVRPIDLLFFMFLSIATNNIICIENEADLFRRTSIATRLLSAYARDKGSEYVKAVLLPVFQKIAERPREDRCFELDPSKLEPDENVTKNINNVIEVTEMFLEAICSSVDLAPRSFREIGHHIVTSVRERFPEAKHTAVGSFIFLRFFCPAIVSPEMDGLVKNAASIPRELRRGFLMATKVIQNLANNVLFGSKETYMIGLNDFLSCNIYRVASFLREISKLPIQEEELPEARRYLMNEKNYALLHHVLAENMENVVKDISTKKLNYVNHPNSLNNWKRELDRFANILAQLGRPPEITKKEPISSKNNIYASSNQFYIDFMRRNSHRNVDSIISSNIIYEGGLSKAGRRVVYLILRNIKVDNIDLELLIYYFVRVSLNPGLINPTFNPLFAFRHLKMFQFDLLKS